MILNTTPLAEVDVSFKILADGMYAARLSAECKPNKAGTGQVVHITCKLLAAELVTRDGDTFENRGFSLKSFISLEAKENYNPNETLKKWALALELDEDSDIQLEDFQGADVALQVVYKPESQGKDGKTYPEGNDVKGYYPLSENPDLDTTAAI